MTQVEVKLLIKISTWVRVKKYLRKTTHVVSNFIIYVQRR